MTIEQCLFFIVRHQMESKFYHKKMQTVDFTSQIILLMAACTKQFAVCFHYSITKLSVIESSPIIKQSLFPMIDGIAKECNFIENIEISGMNIFKGNFFKLIYLIN